MQKLINILFLLKLIYFLSSVCLHDVTSQELPLAVCDNGLQTERHENCSLFWVCIDGVPELFICPGGSYWQQENEQCEPTWNVPECQGGTRPPTSTLPTPTETPQTEPTIIVTPSQETPATEATLPASSTQETPQTEPTVSPTNGTTIETPATEPTIPPSNGTTVEIPETEATVSSNSRKMYLLSH